MSALLFSRSRFRLFLDDVLQVMLVVQQDALGDLEVGDVEDGKKGKAPDALAGGGDVGLDLNGPGRAALAFHGAAERTAGPVGDGPVVKIPETRPVGFGDMPHEPLQGRLELRGLPDEAVQGFGPRDRRIVQVDDPGAAGGDGVDADVFADSILVDADIVAACAAEEEIRGRNVQHLAHPFQQVEGGVALAPLDEPEVLFGHIEFDRQLLLGLPRHGAVEPDP
jgi:hypothetical protein